jgi:hypothetical protein
MTVPVVGSSTHASEYAPSAVLDEVAALSSSDDAAGAAAA